MTRGEAIKKISDATRETGTMRDRSSIENDLIVLEVMGLIKFDPSTAYDTRDFIFPNQRPYVYQIIAQLESLGYEIKLRSS